MRPLAVALLAAASLEAAISITVLPNGSFDVTAGDWRFGGEVGAPVANITVRGGEVSFDYTIDGPRHATIRTYPDRPAVMFTVQYVTGGANIAPFPVFSQYPRLPYHLTYSGIFSIHSFPGFGAEGPWTFFDDNARAFIVSPAANYLTARTSLGPGGAISTGIAPEIPALPPGFTHQTLLVVEDGVNRAFETFGRTLIEISGKKLPPNDSSPLLNNVGYWTDAGSTYYYHMEPGMSYPETLAAVKRDFDAWGIGLGYLQLDSWFYPKGPLADWSDSADGIFEYTAAPALFGPSLRAFEQRLGIPLVTHARWIDDTSPVRQQFRVSGNVAVDPKYWSQAASYLSDSGVLAYEQDWLGDRAHSDFNLTDPYAFLDNMAAAMADRGLTMQYCMATPGDFLQSTRYNNLTNIRTAEDRFDRSRWTNFLYGARLASALGIWPFSDVFMSWETDNLLMATLSAGPIGVGDPIGALDGAGLLRAVRLDGTIVKPDAPLAPLDRSFINDARYADAPMIAATYTDFGGLRGWYVFAYTQGPETAAHFRPAELGISGPVYIYDYFADSGQLLDPDTDYSFDLKDGRAYFVLAPIGPSGIAVLGDRGHFVSSGKKRISSLTDNGAVQLTVEFAPGEISRTIIGYAPFEPIISGGVGIYDPASGRFSVEVTRTEGTQSGSSVLRLSNLDRSGAPGSSGPDRTTLPN